MPALSFALTPTTEKIKHFLAQVRARSAPETDRVQFLALDASRERAKNGLGS